MGTPDLPPDFHGYASHHATGASALRDHDASVRPPPGAAFVSLRLTARTRETRYRLRVPDAVSPGCRSRTLRTCPSRSVR